jgi:hypothetical protein
MNRLCDVTRQFTFLLQNPDGSPCEDKAAADIVDTINRCGKYKLADAFAAAIRPMLDASELRIVLAYGVTLEKKHADGFSYVELTITTRESA